MSHMAPVVVVTYEGEHQLAIEGFGYHTIVGAVEDVLSGSVGPGGKEILKIEIYPRGGRLTSQWKIE